MSTLLDYSFSISEYPYCAFCSTVGIFTSYCFTVPGIWTLRTTVERRLSELTEEKGVHIHVIEQYLKSNIHTII